MINDICNNLLAAGDYKNYMLFTYMINMMNTLSENVSVKDDESSIREKVTSSFDDGWGKGFLLALSIMEHCLEHSDNNLKRKLQGVETFIKNARATLFSDDLIDKQIKIMEILREI